MYLSERLAEYAHSLAYDDLSDAVIAQAKLRILDSIGCAIGAYREAPVAAARALAEKSCRGGSATILGTRRKTTVDMAAFVNGGMVRYLDFNDTYLSREPGHPSDNVPACMAVAEAEGRSGKDLLVAIVLAYELQCRLCDAADIRHRGWDHVCYGLVSAALASGKLMGLSKEQLAQAVNISLNSHLAMRQVRAGELSMWKGFSFANASRNAVFSALLAREGMTGPSPVFEGDMGFFNQVSGRFSLDVKAFGGRGRRFRLEDTFVKFYPAEYHAQTAVWAALELREAVADPKRISMVGVETHEAAYAILGREREKWAPETRETADHSLPYIVTMAILEGKIDRETFSRPKLSDPATREFMKRVIVKEDKALSAEYPGSMANRITVKLDDGRIISKQVDVPRGHPKNPMTQEEIESKFALLTGSVLSGTRSERARRLVMEVEAKGSLGQLLAACVVAP
ncbi:MAG: MmgE/PrpD family protein [Nitrososphaerota archaeon]|nr:MmgE/PrpD family protein [Nitrososphaerota archaeon]MDG6979366.1 MmgE/PrpD family protein [Nitrososphaerota archaeon]